MEREIPAQAIANAWKLWEILDLRYFSLGLADKFVLAIAGETGSGKTTLAEAFESIAKQQGWNVVTLHQDDYFKLPPKQNEQKRRQDLSWVGPSEVNLNLLNKHILMFKIGVSRLLVPRCIRSEDRFVWETLHIDQAQILVVEGTYTLFLSNLDFKVFLPMTYKQTHQRRIRRGREQIDQFLDKVLEIEHQIIQRQRSMADYILESDESNG